VKVSRILGLLYKDQELFFGQRIEKVIFPFFFFFFFFFLWGQGGGVL
jgi:hypothetical protein